VCSRCLTFVSLGLEPRHVGRENIRGLISDVLELFPDFKFEPKDVRVRIDTPTQAFAEYVAHSTAAATGRQVHQLFFGLVEVDNGQITLLREALNTLASAQAVLPHGAADVPAPAKEVSAF